jgi:hypothetical protein
LLIHIDKQMKIKSYVNITPDNLNFSALSKSQY